MKQLLQLNPQPDGVFCRSDPLAMGAFRAIREARLDVPKDIAVVGCGNVHYDDLLRVPLTSLDQDAAGLGESLARLALNIIKKKIGTPPMNVLLPRSVGGARLYTETRCRLNSGRTVAQLRRRWEGKSPLSYNGKSLTVSFELKP